MNKDNRMSIKASARSNLARWLDRLQPSESVVLGGAALLVGLTSGIGVWLFKRLIDLAHLVVFGGLGTFLGKLGIWTVALLPMLGVIEASLLSAGSGSLGWLGFPIERVKHQTPPGRRGYCNVSVHHGYLPGEHAD